MIEWKKVHAKLAVAVVTAFLCGLVMLAGAAGIRLAMAINGYFYSTGVSDMKACRGIQKRRGLDIVYTKTGAKTDRLLVTMGVRVQSLETGRAFSVESSTTSAWPELWEDSLQRLVEDFRAHPIGLRECEIEMGVTKKNSSLNPGSGRKRWEKNKQSKKNRDAR